MGRGGEGSRQNELDGSSDGMAGRGAGGPGGFRARKRGCRGALQCTQVGGWAGGWEALHWGAEEHPQSAGRKQATAHRTVSPRPRLRRGAAAGSLVLCHY